MGKPAKLLTVQFLDWVDRRPRTYADVKDAWKSTCPMNSAWEDATSEGLVAFEHSAARHADDAPVILTPRGRCLLDRAAADGSRF